MYLILDSEIAENKDKPNLINYISSLYTSDSLFIFLLSCPAQYRNQKENASTLSGPLFYIGRLFTTSGLRMTSSECAVGQCLPESARQRLKTTIWVK
jgi:hypothetical protein